MSEALDPDADPEPAPEDPPDTWSGGTDELEMARGNATDRTADPVVFVDARCIGCGAVTVCSVPADAADWKQKRTFARICPSTDELTPHNIIARLSMMNRTHPRGYRNDD